MTEQAIIRLAMVLQNQAPSTLDKYVCKLVEVILFEQSDGMDIANLSAAINEQFSLSFTFTEISRAINRKSNHRVKCSNGTYYLAPTIRESLASLPTIESQLRSYVNTFVDEVKPTWSSKDVYDLLMRFLYYSFNSNVSNLLTLLNKGQVSNGVVFEATNDELVVVNSFISWDNDSKNSFLFNVISIFYEYCMLTIKKDNILSKELFKGKRFYLDANIIFRMAGINNEERQFVTHDFIKHCQDINIELLCTSITLDEVYRVISSKVDLVRGIAGSSIPVSYDLIDNLSISNDITDFYRVYYDWCNTAGNLPGDYISFQSYLFSLVNESLHKIRIKQSTSYQFDSSKKTFDENVKKLKAFKAKRRKRRSTTYASAETDVTNILDIIEWRKPSSKKSIFQTNEFIISADQLLIGWATSIFPGVPIVVLPSVWLSIILKYTGRSDDDYKSFCLFLTQREHYSPDDTINPIDLLKNINTKTSSTKIKEQIISEIIQNKKSYSFGDEKNYDISVDRAFDKVMQEYYGKTTLEISELKAEMDANVREVERSSKQYADERAALEAENERVKTLIVISKKQANDKVRFCRNLKKLKPFAFIVCGALLLMTVLVWIFECQPLFSLMQKLTPEKVNNPNVAGMLWSTISVGFSLVFLGVGKLVLLLGSKKREDRLFEKYYKKNELLTKK